MRRTARVVTTALAGMALLAACNSGGGNTAPEPAGEPTSSPAEQTSAPAPTATDDGGDDSDDGATAAPAAPADETAEPTDGADYSTEPQNDPGWPSSGGELLPTGVRVGSHEGYERVVFDFEGAGTPGWRVEYVDEAVEDGRGDVIDVGGNFTLQVIATGVRYPEGEDENGRVAQGSYSTDGADVIEEVRVTGIFEGQNQAFIGLDEKAPFRAFTLTAPARLVVDVQTTDG